MASRAHQTTNPVRIIAGVIVAYAFPLAALTLWAALTTADGVTLGGVYLVWVLGVMMGSIYVGPALVVWFVLHRWGQARWWTALLTGLVTDLAFLFILPAHPPSLAKPAQALFLLSLGPATGLAVWAAVYWRPAGQGELSPQFDRQL